MNETVIRRVAVALNASLESTLALQAAAELATSMQAELEGIFIEDINLIRLAELPFTREIRPASMTQNAVDLQRMEQELRSLARREQQKLETVAREKGLGCSFSIRRGQIKTELMAAVTRVDVLTVCHPVQYVSGKSPRYTSARISRTPAYAGQPAASNLAVVFGNAENEKRSLLAAARLASDLDAEITVLVLAGSVAEADALQREADSILRPLANPVKFVRITGNQVSDIVSATVSSPTRLLLVNSNNVLVSSGKLWGCLEQVSCPVLIVRGS